MRMLTKLLFGESGTHTGERCLLLLTPCYFVPALTLLDYLVTLLMIHFRDSIFLLLGVHISAAICDQNCLIKEYMCG